MPDEPSTALAGTATLIVLLWGALGWIATPVVLRLLPEPPLEPGESKVPYRDLPARPLALGAALWSVALALVTVGALPRFAWAPYLVVALVGAVGCVIDAATTWLPSRIIHVGWVLTPVALVGSTVASGRGWDSLLRAALGACLVGGLMLLAHVAASFGFSDVRLGLLTGAISAWWSWQTMLVGLFLGSVVGAAWGVAHSVRRGRGTPFPYGPSLLFGPYLALGLEMLTR